MVGSDKAVNRFLEDIRNNLEQEQQAQNSQAAEAARVVINRPVRCTIIVGHPAPRSRKVEAGNKGTSRKG